MWEDRTYKNDLFTEIKYDAAAISELNVGQKCPNFRYLMIL